MVWYGMVWDGMVWLESACSHSNGGGALEEEEELELEFGA